MNQQRSSNAMIEEQENRSQGSCFREPPPLYSVYLLDEDFSTIDFIIDIIRLFFFFSYDKAREIILGEQAKRGKIICGIYTKDVAETKVHQVNRYLRKHKCELMCGMEPI